MFHPLPPRAPFNPPLCFIHCPLEPPSFTPCVSSIAPSSPLQSPRLFHPLPPRAPFNPPLCFIHCPLEPPSFPPSVSSIAPSSPLHSPGPLCFTHCPLEPPSFPPCVSPIAPSSPLHSPLVFHPLPPRAPFILPLCFTHCPLEPPSFPPCVSPIAPSSRLYSQELEEDARKRCSEDELLEIPKTTHQFPQSPTTRAHARTRVRVRWIHLTALGAMVPIGRARCWGLPATEGQVGGVCGAIQKQRSGRR